MKLNDIPHIRLVTQQIADTTFKTVKDIVGWMGAIQAQNYNMAKWAIGVRLPDSVNRNLETAIDKGQIIRTHLLRPTWHFVSADDIYWMLELTAPRIRTSLKSHHKQLGISRNLIKKSNSVIEKMLSNSRHLARKELITELEHAGIDAKNNRGSHLLLLAELEGLICSGKTKGKKQSYALLEERVPKTKSLHRDQALGRLARMYFKSHGPATLYDFAWWAGLTLTNARNALEMVKSDFITETIYSKDYWFHESFSLSEDTNIAVHLLPAFDEFIISYRDRSACLSKENHKKVVSTNGIFRPALIVNGKVAGIWKRTVQKNTVVVETNFFHPLSKHILNLLEKKVTEYGNFLKMETVISYNMD